MSILQYLTTYSEPECACPPPSGEYSHVVVVPAFDEQPSLLHGFASPKTADNNPLWIIVVNASEDRSDSEIERTRYLLSALSTGAEELGYPGIVLAKHSIGDLVIVDRVSPGRLLPEKQGVGLARKIGCDLALAWGQQGRITSPWIHCTDADVTLPRDYFDASDAYSEKSEVAALCFPFWHDAETASSPSRFVTTFSVCNGQVLRMPFTALAARWRFAIVPTTKYAACRSGRLVKISIC
jgi:hypothetical protein